LVRLLRSALARAWDCLISMQAARKGLGLTHSILELSGMNVGKGGRLEYSDTNVGDPTIDFNYRMEF
jgi:hypothetical protein